jgi:hypothetical protein
MKNIVFVTIFSLLTFSCSDSAKKVETKINELKSPVVIRSICNSGETTTVLLIDKNKRVRLVSSYVFNNNKIGDTIK